MHTKKDAIGLGSPFSKDQVSNSYYLMIRRFLDILLIICSFPLILPIFMLLSLILFFRFKGKIFYTQNRVGFQGKPFNIIKFRTMSDCPSDEINYINQENESVSKFCNFLRIHRLDEIPQILNVIKGDMSIVGPRPEIVSQYKYFADNVESYKLRKIVPQGITGLAQINYPPTVTIEGAKEKLKYDIKYINNLSFLTDVKIISKTIIQMFTGKNSG